MAKISKRLLPLLLVAALAATLTFSVVACNKGNDPIEEGWYLSLSSSGYPVYDNVSSVPDAVAMKEEGGVWSISVTLAQNEQFFIKSTSGKSVGFDSVFSAATQLVAGDDGAIKVAVAGAYVLSYDGESITYSYTPPAAVQLTGIALSQTTLALEKGTAQQLVLSFLPEGVAPVGVIWTSSASDIVSVTQEGLVTAVNYGTATITVTSTSGGFSATCVVSVLKHAAGLSLSVPNLSVVAKGLAKTIEVNFYPDDANEHAYIASLTSGAEFAELSDDGVGNISVYGKAEGTAILSVSLVSDPEFVATCAITILPEGSVLANLPASLDMKIGEETTITASLENYDGEPSKAVWSVSGAALLMSSDGASATLTAKDFGVATVTVALFDDQNNTYRSSCTVYVGEEFFFIYGYGLGGGDWVWQTYLNDPNVAEANELLLHEESKGVWTLTRELTPDNGFQIIFPSVGSFTEDVDGEQMWNKNIPSDLVAAENYYDSARSDSRYVSNATTSYLCVTTPGIYKITLDLTGASAKVYINVVSFDVAGISLKLSEGDYILDGEGATAVLQYSVLPASALYSESDVRVELTSDLEEFANYIRSTLDFGAGTITLQALAVPSQTFTVTLHLYVTEFEETLDFYLLGGAKVPVTSISFDQPSYEFNLNNGMSNYTTYVSAHVNDGATNRQVRYSYFVPETASESTLTVEALGRREHATVDPVTGAVTKYFPGTVRIKAESLEDPNIVAYTDVLFYTDSYYIIAPSGPALSPSITSFDGITGDTPGFIAAVPRDPNCKTQYRLEVIDSQIDGHYLNRFSLAFLGMNEMWNGKIGSAAIKLGNATMNWTGADYMNDVGCIKILDPDHHSKSFEFIIDISLARPVLAINVIGKDEFDGFGLYPYDDGQDLILDYNNPAYYQKLKHGQSTDFKLIIVPDAEISAEDVSFSWENNDQDFSYEFDVATRNVKVKRLDTLLETDKTVTLNVTYQGVTRKFIMVAPATHHWVQKYDDAHHWLECSDDGCGERKDVTEHVMIEGWQQDRANGEHYHACSDCGYTCDHAAHIFASASQIDLTKGDIPACSVCGEKIVAIEDNKLVGYYGKAGKIVLPDTITEIGAHIFDGHTELRSINWPSSLTTIGDYAFRDCTGLPTITLPASVASIGQYAFSGFKSKITIPAGSQLGSIGAHAFDGCLGDIDLRALSNGNNYIGSYAFANSGIIVFSVDCGYLTMAEHAFENCTKLTRVEIKCTIFESIPNSAFAGCTSLTEVYLTDRYDVGGLYSGLFSETPWDYMQFWKFSDKAFDGCVLLQGIYIERVASHYVFKGSSRPDDVDPDYSYVGDCSALYGKIYVYSNTNQEYAFYEGHGPYIAGIWHYRDNVRDLNNIEVWD